MNQRGYGGGRPGEGSGRWRGGKDEPWGSGDLSDERGRGRQNERYSREFGQRGGYGAGGYESDRRGERHDRSDEDRGFFQRAGEEIRSWFGGGEDERYGDQRRYGDQDRWERGRGHFGQTGYGGGMPGQESWGGSGFGGGAEHGRRFDRIDAGSTGTHGAHPMSSPVGGGWEGGYGTSARWGSMMRGAYSGVGGYGGTSHYDPHYSEWRNRQIEELDRDYDDYCRENQSRFEQEFCSWRERRQGQRQAMRRIHEQMEVVGSDDEHVGTVDHLMGDRIILTRNDERAGGVHHSIPCAWLEKVDDKVRLNKSAEEAMRMWQDEDQNQAMFGGRRERGEGPHMLNRSFAGTYDEREEKDD